MDLGLHACGFTCNKVNSNDNAISSCHGAVVRFSLNGTTYQNNSLVTLEDISEGDDALLCITNLTACCRPSEMGYSLGNWYFPNGTRMPSSGKQWDFHRTRGWMVVHMHRRRGGVDGIYRCVIPVTTSIDHTVYIGVYTASTGKPSPTKYKCGCYASS